MNNGRQLTSRIKLVVILLVCVTLVKGQSDKEISIGIIDSTHSVVLNEDRELFISLPKSYHSNKDSRYPVLYVLDGETYFQSFTGLVDFLTFQNGNAIIPEMIVVGLVNRDRFRDFTPSKVEQHPESGNADMFTKYIREELIPYVDKQYRTTKYRVLFGHSFGGLFAVNTLLHHRDLFRSYIVIDPSLWWDNNSLVRTGAKAINDSTDYTSTSLYLATADMMSDTAADTDTTTRSLPVRAVMEFRNLLKTNMRGLRFTYKAYTDENHGTVPLISTYDALRFLFDFFKRPSFSKIPDPAFNADSVLKAHYESVSKRIGYKVIPPESLVNGIAWLYAINKLNSKAIHFYKMNIENYPSSVYAYYSLASFYESFGETKQAIIYFEISLAVSHDEAIVQKINELKSKR